MTPTFMGSEPARADSGKYKGTAVLEDEQDKGLAMMRALRAEQQAKARIRLEKTGNGNVSEAYKDNVELDYAGIRVAELDAAQRKQLRELIALYVSNMDEGHARVKMSEVDRHMDETRFAWMGASDPDAVFYYRVQSPVILIEFDHQRPVFLPRSERPIRNHVHTVVRTPNGNDYGKDLLRQHHAKHPHTPSSSETK